MKRIWIYILKKLGDFSGGYGTTKRRNFFIAVALIVAVHIGVMFWCLSVFPEYRILMRVAMLSGILLLLHMHQISKIPYVNFYTEWAMDMEEELFRARIQAEPGMDAMARLKKFLSLEPQWKHGEEILALVAPAVSLMPSKTGQLDTFMGGRPVLASGSDWPMHDGRELDFLAQIDLKEAAAAGLDPVFPGGGYLVFFYAANVEEPEWDVKSGSKAIRVIHSIKPWASAPGAGSHCYEIRKLESLPHPDSAACSGLKDRDSSLYREIYYGIRKDGWGWGHQIGGWPDLIQNDILPSGAPKKGGRVLLAQFDSDDLIGWCWGDVGKLYFMVSEDDLAKGRFDRVSMEMQCT